MCIKMLAYKKKSIKDVKINVWMYDEKQNIYHL